MITDQQINEQNDQIQEALRNSRAHASDGANIMASRVRERDGAAASPREGLRSYLLQFDRLAQWARIKQTVNASAPTDHQFARERSVAVLALLDDALKRLDKRTGERVDNARAWLGAQRSTIAKALAAFESVGADLSGPAAVALIDRMAGAASALDRAQAAKQHATRETVDQAHLEVERCLADQRQVDRDIAALYDAIGVPEFPSFADFKDARESTFELELPKNPTAALVLRAIEEGIRAKPRAKLLWVVFESKPDHELVQWRWRGASGT